MTGARSLSIACVSAALALILACSAPRPSREPLGWGPLPKGAHVLGSASPKPRARRGDSRKAAAPAAESPADGGAQEAAQKTEAPSTAKGEPPPPAASGSAEVPQRAAPQDFVGEFRGEDVATYHIASMPDRVERDPNARINAKVGSGDAVDFVLVDSSNGNEICTLTGDVKEGKAVIRSGQKCFEQSGADVSASATVRDGSAKMDGSRLAFELALDVAMTFGPNRVEGTLDYRFDGKRR